jgi:hypothetical protein
MKRIEYDPAMSDERERREGMPQSEAHEIWLDVAGMRLHCQHITASSRPTCQAMD